MFVTTLHENCPNCEAEVDQARMVMIATGRDWYQSERTDQWRRVIHSARVSRS